MAPVPFPVSSSPGAHPQEGAGRLINAHVVKTEQGAPTPIKWVRSPGLLALVTSTRSGYRGFIEVNGNIISILGSRVQLLTKSGTTYAFTDLGALSGTDLVTVAKNNAATADIVCVTSDGAFNLFTASAPTAFSDSDLPTPNSVCAVKGYFCFTHGSGRISASDLNSVSVNSLSYTTAPASLLRGVSFRDQLFAFGENFCQVYADAGTTPFPFALQTTIPVGLAGTHAVAGWEPGFTGTMCWVAQDDTVRKLDGYVPTVISTEDVSRDIAATPDKTVLECCCYMSNGNAVFAVTRPGYWTWEHNLTTATWNERKSYGQDDWRVSRTVRAFGTWIAGNRDTGAVSEISATTYREGSEPLVLEMISGAVQAFPARLGVRRLDVNMVAAVGVAAGEEGIETDPQVQIKWAKDGGYTFGNPVLRSIGAEGDSKRSVSVSRLGACGPKGFRIGLTVSDPVPVVVFGADISGIETRAPG